MMRKILILLLVALTLTSLWATEKVNLSTLSEGGITITNAEERLDLTGSYSGCVTIHSDSDFILVLDNVDITSETSAIFFEGNARNIVIFIKGTNNLETVYSSNKVKQATLELCSENTVTTSIFTGNGTLNITAAKKHGIHVQKAVINSGNINIEVQETSTGHGIKVEDEIIINDVKLDIHALGNISGDESKGIVIVGHEYNPNSIRPNPEDALCNIIINGGDINIVSMGKAISAKWESEDGDTVSIDDDPVARVIINNGQIIIKTIGEVYYINEDKKLSPEGIEGKDYVIINGGLIDILASDDAINGKYIEIHGGTIIAQSTVEDGIDANRSILISGGTVIALSDKIPSEAIDCDSGRNFTWTGGDIIAIGGSSSCLPPWYGLGLGYYKKYSNLSYFGYKTIINVINSHTKECLLSFSIPEIFSNYLSLSIFAGSEKSNGFCDVVFSIDEE